MHLILFTQLPLADIRIRSCSSKDIALYAGIKLYPSQRISWQISNFSSKILDSRHFIPTTLLLVVFLPNHIGLLCPRLGSVWQGGSSLFPDSQTPTRRKDLRWLYINIIIEFRIIYLLHLHCGHCLVTAKFSSSFSSIDFNAFISKCLRQNHGIILVKTFVFFFLPGL